MDPLFSSGLALSLSAINLLAHRLIEAKADQDFSRERFLDIEIWSKKGLDHYDRLVSCSYIAFRSFELWNAWYRIWILGSLYGGSGQDEILSRYEATGDPAVFANFEKCPYRGTQAIDLKKYADLFHAAASEIETVRDRRLSAQAAAERIYGLLGRSNLCPPAWNLTRSTQRYPGTFTLMHMSLLFMWFKLGAPEAIKQHYFTQVNHPLRFLNGLGQIQQVDFSRSMQTVLGVMRDTIFSWNEDSQ